MLGGLGRTLAIAAMLLGPAALAGEVRGHVTIRLAGSAKSDRSGVVVFVADQPLPPGRHADAVMAQAGRQFSPRGVAIPVGGRVRFPNRDSLEHNVFSRSPHATFDLGRYARGPGKVETFDQPGVVDVYCNVHSDMVGHVVVVPGPWAVTKADGTFAIRGLTPGRHALVVWDRLGTPAIRRTSVDVPAAGAAALDLALDESAAEEPPHANKFGGAYRTKSY